tara:strand:+ start:274 stop:486 length:213 start_codon:yes stop_codon:yes gene_type:complete
MAFNAGSTSVNGREQIEIQNTPQSPNQLTYKEIEVLLSLIKRSNFLGEDIEPLYNMVIKLQNQYLEQHTK